MKLNVGDKVLVEAVVDEIYLGEEEFGVCLQGCKTEKFLVHKVYPYKEKTYEDGLSEAWKTARKLIAEKHEGGLEGREITQIFGKNFCDGYGEIFDIFTADEAAAKIAEWESGQEIRVGDVVKTSKGKNGMAIVSWVDDTHCYVIWDDGTCGMHENDEFIKTGRTIDIEELLAQIGGEEDAV